MVKQISILFLVFIGLNNAVAQDLDAFNAKRLDLNKKGMAVLGSWAIANIAMSPILATSASGSEKYFHQMNGYWNGVNLIIAGLGYYGAVKSNPNDLSMSQTLKEQQKIEKSLLFNTGLDLAYIAGGFYLKERAKNSTENTDRLKGFGQSLMLQGGFLFAFDIVFYLVQKNHGSKLFSMIDNLAIQPTGFKIKWNI
jgi:hypothetical protein